MSSFGLVYLCIMFHTSLCLCAACPAVGVVPFGSRSSPCRTHAASWQLHLVEHSISCLPESTNATHACPSRPTQPLPARVDQRSPCLQEPSQQRPDRDAASAVEPLHGGGGHVGPPALPAMCMPADEQAGDRGSRADMYVQCTRIV
jgi:hypothetical protein